jgi:hypothetical protein
MSRLIIVAQQKGGTRKTFLTVHLKTFLDAKKLDFTPVDMDYEDDLIPRIFPNAITLSPDPQELAEGSSELRGFMRQLLDEPSNTIVDSGANTGTTWFSLLTHCCPTLKQDLADKGIKVTLVIPVDGSKKASDCFTAYKSMWPDATLILVGIRHFRTQELTIPQHDPALTIEVPMPTPLLFETYRTLAMSIEAIRDTPRNDTKLSLQRSEAFWFLPELHKQFEKILPHLLP